MAATTKRPAAPANGATASNIPQRIIDLAAARAARAEAHREPVILKWDEGIEFTLPAEMPVEFALCAQEDNMRGALVALLGDDQASEFFALRPSMDDVQDLSQLAGKVYGITPGESVALAKP